MIDDYVTPKEKYMRIGRGSCRRRRRSSVTKQHLATNFNTSWNEVHYRTQVELISLRNSDFWVESGWVTMALSVDFSYTTITAPTIGAS